MIKRILAFGNNYPAAFILFLSLILSFQSHSQIAMWHANNTQSCGMFGTNSIADASYSFRKVNACYVGNVVTVRRASDNATSTFTYATNFVDTSAIKTFIGASDAFVVTLNDVSGNGYHMTQATNSQQPKIATAGSLIYADGKLAILFDGSNDILEAGSFTAEMPFSFFAVSKRASANLFTIMSIGNSLSLGNANVQNFNSGSQVRASYNNGVTFYGATVGTANTNLNLCTALFYSNTAFASNGTSTASTSTTGSLVANTFSLGAIHRSGFIYSDGYFVEAAAYKSDQSSNRTTIESNIKTYYGL
jgi:hypothetical protein